MFREPRVSCPSTNNRALRAGRSTPWHYRAWRSASIAAMLGLAVPAVAQRTITTTYQYNACESALKFDPVRFPIVTPVGGVKVQYRQLVR